MLALTRQQHPDEIQRYEHIRSAPNLGPLRCFAQFPGDKYQCTLAHRHPGPHVAHTYGDLVVAVWDQQPGDGAGRLRAAARAASLLRMVAIGISLGILVIGALLKVLVAALLLIASSTLFGWFQATRALGPLDRPLGASGQSGVVAFVASMALLLAGVILAGSTVGWLGGLVAVVVGFWLFPSISRVLWGNWFTSQS